MSASLFAIFIKVALASAYAPPAVADQLSATSVVAAAVRPAFLPMETAAFSANSSVSSLLSVLTNVFAPIDAKPPTNKGAASCINSTDTYSPKNAAG